jgi:hypothetical protein
MSKIAIIDFLIPKNSDDGMMMISTVAEDKLYQDARLFNMLNFEEGVKELIKTEKLFTSLDIDKEHKKHAKRALEKL